MGIQRFLGRQLRGNSLTQLFVMNARQVAKKQRATNAGGTSVIQDRLVVVTPAISQPQRDLIAAGFWTARGQLEGEFAGLFRRALLQ